ncbi:potassium channel family protein [Paenibacillus sp. TRM 82003]|uniref:potassium channel family protein n=1 Tax=Kineococcus sp. TRM81007 TaxID=2925831 RepID=UPI001F58C2C1|nr:potassium channel family protein [Kineococcus sp. TRM81007]MCI2237150.1 potassium channel family protein [Kineococcus sp. TRM81007]MCI3925271.1 potassium channel family protein [Paenibacillus sp. TRM 82003]
MLAAVEIIAGAVLVVLVLVDALVTTLSVSTGAGPLTSRVTGALWRLLRWRHPRGREGTPLRFSGVLLLTVTASTWVLLLWAGWSLLFVGSGAVVNSTTGRAAGVLDTVYFAGFSTATLGVGDYTANQPGWRLLAAVAGFTGFLLITLAVTYLLSVVQAVVASRALAMHVFALGAHPQEVVARGWNGERFSSAFVQHLVSLSSEVAQVAEQHLAYPVLHYCHTGKAAAAASRAVATLDEAMLILSAGVAADARPDGSAVAPVREAVSGYAQTVAATSALVPTPDAPDAPALTALAEAGVPLADSRSFEQAVRAEADRRAGLRRVVDNSGWTWPRAG